MKYNGQEVTEEFVELVTKRVWNKCRPLVQEEQVISVLQSAEEVWQEMQPESSGIKVGDHVRHVDKKWEEDGVGRVRAISSTGKSAEVGFPHSPNDYYRRRGARFSLEKLIKVKED